jgi:hypothetical protein
MTTEISKRDSFDDNDWSDFREDLYTGADASADSDFRAVRKLEAGVNYLRGLPKPKGKSTIFKKTVVHWIHLPEWEDRWFMLPCVDAHPEFRSEGAYETCAVCPRHKELERKVTSLKAIPQGRRTQEQNHQLAVTSSMVKLLQPQTKYRANFVNMKDPELRADVYEVGVGVFKELKKLIQLPEDLNGGNFTDPSPAGYTILLTKSGSGMDTEYKVELARKPSPLADKATVRRLYESQADLDTMLRMPDAEDIFTACDEVMAYVDTQLSAPPPPTAGALPGKPANKEAQLPFSDVPHSAEGGQVITSGKLPAPEGANTSGKPRTLPAPRGTKSAAGKTASAAGNIETDILGPES